MPRTPVQKKSEPKRRIAAKGYKLAAPIPSGTRVTDVAKKSWQFGESIGVGGFGEIYAACEVDPTAKKVTRYPYVIKVEPQGNGPLFVERNFYLRAAKLEDINEWKLKKKLKSFGMPHYCGSGSFDFQNEKYRFLVMERFGRDLSSIYEENKKTFPLGTTFLVALQVLDVLEYIHSRSYVHADIKAANLLLDERGEIVYLVDYGLAARYSTDCKPDPKKAHDGTIDYTSRDAHMGVKTRRGDFEILGYNIVHWLTSHLPWEKVLTNPVKVHEEKNLFMKDVKKSLAKCFGKSPPPDTVVDYMLYVSKLSAGEEPDYERCRKFFRSGIAALGVSGTGKLDFSLSVKSPLKRRSTQESGKAPVAKKAKEVTGKGNKKEMKENCEAKNNVQSKTVTSEVSSQGYRVNGIIDLSSDIDTEESMIADESQEDIYSPPPVSKPVKSKTKRRVSIVAKKVIKPVPKKRLASSKKSDNLQSKPSWRDCPTIAAGYLVQEEVNKRANTTDNTEKKKRQKVKKTVLV